MAARWLIKGIPDTKKKLLLSGKHRRRKRHYFVSVGCIHQGYGIWRIIKIIRSVIIKSELSFRHTASENRSSRSAFQEAIHLQILFLQRRRDMIRKATIIDRKRAIENQSTFMATDNFSIRSEETKVRVVYEITVIDTIYIQILIDIRKLSIRSDAV